PGEDFSLTIEVHNYKANAATNVVVADRIPAGTSYVTGSSNFPVQQNGDQLVWTFPTMKSLETIKITYKLKAESGTGSTTLWYDDVEVGEDNWDINLARGDQVWYRDEGYGVDQSYSWIAEEKEGITNDFFLFTKNQFLLSGTDPSLYFYHFYNTEQGFDGGFIEVSKDGFIWKPVRPEQFSLNGYTGLINYNTFTTPNLSAFSGQSKEFIPTVLDLGEYAGEKIQVRFRFGNDSLIVSPDNSTILGWVVDNIEFIHPKFYNAEVCATNAGGDSTCTSMFGKGVLVDSDKIVGTKSEKPLASNLRIFPNPAGEYFLVKMDLTRPYRQLILRTVSGQEIKRINLDGKNALVKVPASDLPRGMILVEAIGDRLYTQSKLILH
ncbi:MAG TPA: hypothetical protein VFX48_03670, partial [Saprospiraceae bacterium]|nr:hypothetical protein [Saprospiraceae bacterium]